MNLSNYSIARQRFMSSIETLKPPVLTGPDVDFNMTISVKDLKALLSYFSVVHTREPIVSNSLMLKTIRTQGYNEVMDFRTFKEITTVDNKSTFYFQESTFVNKAPLKFYDKGLLGEINVYRPFNSSDVKDISSMLSMTIDEIRQFSDGFFKFKTYRGIVGFSRVDILEKGYTTYLSDRDLYIIVIASKFVDNKPNTYMGVMFSGD